MNQRERWIATLQHQKTDKVIFHRAVAMSVYVIRAFVRLREEAVCNLTLAKRLAGVEKTLFSHDTALPDLYEKIRPRLLPPPEPPRRQIGSHVKEG